MSADAVAAQVAARLAQLWQTSRPSILERLAVLQASGVTLQQDAQDGEARNRGREAAHKLSGVLGVFGLPRGSEIAAEIEHVLKSGEPLTPADLALLQSRIAELKAVIASKA
jgi:HPt (histidine-containing phosphotransfer) domain-containing protein